LGKGWREIGDQKGCERVAADIIAQYRDEKLAQSIMILNWHEAQLRASAGDTERAIVLFQQTVLAREKIAAQSGDRSDALYALATIAFLQRDRVALEARRAELAALQKPDWYDAMAEKYVRENPQAAANMVWPPNLDVVDGLIACFDKPYGEAYTF